MRAQFAIRLCASSGVRANGSFIGSDAGTTNRVISFGDFDVGGELVVYRGGKASLLPTRMQWAEFDASNSHEVHILRRILLA